MEVIGPSVYSEMVWSARQLRAQAGLASIDWIVLRNRVGTQRMVNKEKMEHVLKLLSKRIGFRIAPGFSEQVIFRELFPRGLTLLDLKEVGVKQLNISNIAARQELRDLMKALKLPSSTIDLSEATGKALAERGSATTITPCTNSVPPHPTCAFASPFPSRGSSC